MQAVQGGHLFDGDDLVALPVVVIDGSRIVSVGEAPPADVEIVDLGDDVTVLPGLIDTHQHLVFNGVGTLEEQVVGFSNDELRERARENAKTALAAGITTLRDLGDRDFVTLDLRGDPELPTILCAGPPLTVVQGHCWYLNGECADRAALVAAVEERAQRGCDVVKIMVTGGSLTPTFPMWASQFNDEELELVIATARHHGLPVAAHCHGVDGMLSAARLGVDTIEHCTFFTESGGSEPTSEVIQAIVDSGVTVSATVGVLPGGVRPPIIAANEAKMVASMQELYTRGCRIVAGTDAGIAPPKPHNVLPYAAIEHFAQMMSPIESLRTLTAHAAAACNVADRKGQLRPGFDADLLAVRGDPTTDPSALLAVAGVWARGRRSH